MHRLPVHCHVHFLAADDYLNRSLFLRQVNGYPAPDVYLDRRLRRGKGRHAVGIRGVPRHQVASITPVILRSHDRRGDGGAAGSRSVRVGDLDGEFRCGKGRDVQSRDREGRRPKDLPHRIAVLNHWFLIIRHRHIALSDARFLNPSGIAHHRRWRTVDLIVLPLRCGGEDVLAVWKLKGSRRVPTLSRGKHVAAHVEGRDREMIRKVTCGLDEDLHVVKRSCVGERQRARAQQDKAHERCNPENLITSAVHINHQRV